MEFLNEFTHMSCLVKMPLSTRDSKGGGMWISQVVIELLREGVLFSLIFFEVSFCPIE